MLSRLRPSLFLDILALALSLGIFLGLALPQLDLPGAYYDEAHFAVPAMQVLNGQQPDLIRDVGISAGGRKLPLMITDRESALSSYLLVPFFWALDVGLVSMRLLPVLGSAATLILAYCLGKALFGRGAAVIAVLLLASLPSYVFFSRQGLDANTLMTAMSTGSLLCLLRWHRGGGVAWLWLAALLIGLGLAIKALFLWYVAALAVLGLLFSPRLNVVSLARRLFRARLRPLSAWPVAAAVPFLVAGAWLPIYYNMRTQGTWALLRENLGSTSAGIENAAYLDNLGTRIYGLTRLLDGSLFWHLGGIFWNPLLPGAFAAALVLGVALVIARRIRLRAFALVSGFIVVMMLMSPFSTSNLTPTHLFILLPFPQLLMGASVWAVVPRTPLKLPAAMVALALVGVLIGWNIKVDFDYHRALARTGGLLNHSDAISDLARYLDANRGTPAYSMDWGIRSGVQLLTQGRVDPQELFMYAPEPNQTFRDWTWGALGKPEALFIFHPPGATMYPRYDAFLELAKMRGRTVRLEHTSAQRDGSPLYLVYSVR